MFHYFREVNEKIHAFTEDSKQRKVLLMLSVSAALSTQMELPSSDVVDSETFFNDSHSDLLLDQLSTLNERIIIDIDETYKLTKEFWLLRYRVIHRPTHPTVQRLLCGLFINSPSALSEGSRDAIHGIDSDNIRRFTAMAIEVYSGEEQ